MLCVIRLSRTRIAISRRCLSLTIRLDIRHLEEFALSSLMKHRTDLNSSEYKMFEVFNPATGELIGKLPSAQKADVDAQAKTAMSSWQSAKWRRSTGRERAAIIEKMV